MSNRDETPAPRPNWFRILTIGRRPGNTLLRVTVLIFVCLIVFGFRILLPIRVEGISMLPTYTDKSVHIINCLPYWFHGPQRGDIVSIRLAGIHVMYLKRIIALPGETIAFENGHAVVNGQPLAEPYEKWSCDWNMPPEKLAPGEYFVVGDNRTMPIELHVHGRVQRDRILGKILL